MKKTGKMRKRIKRLLIKIILYLDKRESEREARKKASAEREARKRRASAARRKGKKRYRWKYKKQAMVLLLFVLILLLAVMIVSKTKNKSGKNEQDVILPVTILERIQDLVTSEAEAALSGNINPYKRLYYYDSTRLKRYMVYQACYPDMKTSDVVWRVNVNLDKKRYKYWEPVSNGNSSTVLVTKTFFIGKNFEPSGLKQLSNGVSVKAVAAAPFERLKKAAAEKGHNIHAESGYRSYNTQKRLYLNYYRTDGKKADTYSARPGFSEHQTGLAIDVLSDGMSELTEFTGTADAKWLKDNAYKYGFIIRYTNENRSITGYTAESWHIRYIGKKHSYKMHKLNISSYEEYKVKYIDYSKDRSEAKTEKAYLSARKIE